jgi:hypothetical protein
MKYFSKNREKAKNNPGGFVLLLGMIFSHIALGVEN